MKKIYIYLVFFVLLLVLVKIPLNVGGDTVTKKITCTVIPEHSVIQGKWKVFNYNLQGNFDGYFLHGNRIIGSINLNDKYADIAMYLDNDRFSGIVRYSFLSVPIEGDYIIIYEYIILFWSIPKININGWFFGHIT